PQQPTRANGGCGRSRRGWKLLDGDRFHEEGTGGEEPRECFLVVLTREPGLATLGGVEFGIVPLQRPAGARVACFATTDESVHSARPFLVRATHGPEYTCSGPFCVRLPNWRTRRRSTATPRQSRCTGST